MYVQTSKYGWKKPPFFRSEISIPPKSLANDQPLVATEPNPKPDADEFAKPMASEHGKARKSNPVEKQKTRRGGIKHKGKHTRTFSLLGNNSAGLKANSDTTRSWEVPEFSCYNSFTPLVVKYYMV